MTLLRSSLFGALLLLLLVPSGAAFAQDTSGGGPMSRPAVERNALRGSPADVQYQLDYPDTDIKDIIKDFSDKYGWNFLIDPKLSGKITLMSPTAVNAETALRAFEHALDATGYALIELETFRSGANKGKPSLIRVVPAKDAMKETLKIYGTGSRAPRNGKLVTQLVQLNNVSADEISKVISKMISGDGDLIAYSPSNTLIITDSANNVRRLMDLINELDISAPRQKLEVVQVQFAEAQRVVDIINELYGQQSGQPTATPAATSASARRANRRNRNAKTKAAATPAKASTTSVGDEPSFIGKMIADERTNTIIVLATEKALVEIKDLIQRIDYETDPLASQDIHVIYLNHAKAEEISQTINNLIQAANQRSQSRRNTPAATGRTSSDRNAARAATAGTGGSSAGGNFAGEVRVTHDVATNSLVITASRDDFRRLKRVIDMLDIPRKQVFVETVIMEVSDSVRDDQGANWHGGVPGDTTDPTGAHIIGARGSQSLNLGSALLDGSLLGGLALGVFGNSIDLPIPGLDGGLSIPAFGLVLRALQEDSSTNVLSAPNLLTLDNKEASIEIGETVPFPTGGFLGGSTGTTGLSLPSISFTREDVGIILRLTPQVNDSGFVTMEIYQEISEVKEGSATASSGGPTTTKRSAETTVSVQSNQTIVIGGLMQEVETETESKVPILGDIPILGFFFRNKAKTKRKTNLLIFLTPHVIETPADLQEVYKVKMMQREEFMRRFYGKSIEDQRDELNELIRYSMNIPEQPSVYREWNGEERSRDGEVDMDLDSFDDAVRNNAEAGDVLITPDGEVRIVSSGEPDTGGSDEDSDDEAAPSGGDEATDPADDPAPDESGAGE